MMKTKKKNRIWFPDVYNHQNVFKVFWSLQVPSRSGVWLCLWYLMNPKFMDGLCINQTLLDGYQHKTVSVRAASSAPQFLQSIKSLATDL
jgi:hypothetical protein